MSRHKPIVENSDGDSTQGGPRFFKTMAYILKNNRLSSTDKLVFSLLTSLAELKGYSWARNEYLAKSLKRSPSTISNSIRRLERYSYILIDDPKSFKRRVKINHDITNGSYLSYEESL